MKYDYALDKRDLHDFNGATCNQLSSVGREWFDSPAPFNERVPKYLYEEIWVMALSGMSGRAISRKLGYHKNQIRRVLRKNKQADMALCPCGLPRKHQGWCKIRFEASESRQETMRLMHLKAKLIKLKRSGKCYHQLKQLDLKNV